MRPSASSLLLVLALAAAVTACGTDDGDNDDVQGPGPSGRETAVSGGEAADYILDESELPEGWRYAAGQQNLGIPEFCDIVLEPADLASVETQRYTMGFSGPFVIQYSFVSANEEAAARAVDPLTADDLCKTFEINGSTIAVSQIDDIPPVGEGFAALRGDAVGVKPDTAQEFVVFRNGTHVTVLISYSLATLATREDLSVITAAVGARSAQG